MLRFETIDCHAHLGWFEGYDLSEETLLSEMHRAGIALALVSNVDGAKVEGRTRALGETETNRATVQAVRRHPSRLRGLLWARPESGNAALLEPFLSETVGNGDGCSWTDRLFVGIKLHPEMNGFPADDLRVDAYMELAATAGLPVVAHCDGTADLASAERIYRLARRHPQVPVVLYHMGFGGPHEPAIRAAETSIARGDARLYLETSQAPVEVVLDALDRVGAERVLFGTDATYFGPGHYEHYSALRAALAGRLDACDLCRVLSRNARELFNLSPEPAA
jgi:uncharacterized protein